SAVPRTAVPAPVPVKLAEEPAPPTIRAPGPAVAVLPPNPVNLLPRPEGAAGAAAEGPPSAPPPAKAQPLARKEPEPRVREMRRQATNEAAELYNTGYPTACAYLFHGSLMSVDPLLDHRPEIQKMIRKGIADAKRISSMDKRAWAFRYLIDDIRNGLRDKMEKVEVGKGDTLWQRLGGEANVQKIISDCVDAAIADPKVNFFRDGKYRMTPAQIVEMKKKLVILVSAATGGPDKYQGKSMKESHKGMGITNAEYDALLTHLKIALVRNSVEAE